MKGGDRIAVPVPSDPSDPNQVKTNIIVFESTDHYRYIFSPYTAGASTIGSLTIVGPDGKNLAIINDFDLSKATGTDSYFGLELTDATAADRLPPENPDVRDYLEDGLRPVGRAAGGTTVMNQVWLTSGKAGQVIEVHTGGGRDYVNGGDSNDVIHLGDGNDYANGAGGDDFLFGGNGRDIMHGGAGRDNIYGNGGDDVILGDGNITFRWSPQFVSLVKIETIPGYWDDLGGYHPSINIETPGGSEHRLNADGTGFDEYGIYTGSINDPQSYNWTMSAKKDTDHVHLFDFQTIHHFWLPTNVQNRLAADGGADFIYGGGGNDIMYAGTGGDQLYGEDGDDRLIAGAGDGGIFDGGANDDTLVIGSGNGNKFMGGSGHDVYEISSSILPQGKIGNQDKIIDSDGNWSLKIDSMIINGNTPGLQAIGENHWLIGEEVSEKIRIHKPRTLANLDCQGRGPDGRLTIGGKVCYPRDQVVIWLAGQVKKH